MEDRARDRWRNAALGAALVVSLILVAMLAAQKRSVTRQYEALFERVTAAQPGYRVPPVAAVTLAEDSVILGASQLARVQVLLFYTTTCPHCRATVPWWNRIARALPQANVMGVQLDSSHLAGEYVATQAVAFTVIPLDTALAARITGWYRVPGVPFTMVIGDGGVVAYSRRGRIESGAAVDSVMTAVDAANQTRAP